MAVLLFVGAILSGGAGYLILTQAKSAIHEIEAFVLFLICAVLLVGAAVVDAVNTGFRKMSESANEDAGEA